MTSPRTHLFTSFLIAALSVHFGQLGYAQQAVVTVPATPVPAAPILAPSTPGQTVTDATKSETPSIRRSGKSKYVLALPKEYEAKDKNGDGQIALYEWERSKYAEFFKLDKNGDGFLTAQELTPKTASTGARLRMGGAADMNALPNPGSLIAYNQKMGETFAFTVTGQRTGAIWGTGTYTTDSDLATAAVHAGILKDGETGTVRVTITASPAEFVESTSGGIASTARTEGSPAAFTLR